MFPQRLELWQAGARGVSVSGWLTQCSQAPLNRPLSQILQSNFFREITHIMISMSNSVYLTIGHKPQL